jgi:hypothetical protein
VLTAYNNENSIGLSVRDFREHRWFGPSSWSATIAAIGRCSMLLTPAQLR